MEKDRNTGFDNRPRISLMFSFIDIKIYPSLFLTLPFPSPLKPARGLGERCKLPQRGPGRSQGRKRI